MCILIYIVSFFIHSIILICIDISIYLYSFFLDYGEVKPSSAQMVVKANLQTMGCACSGNPGWFGVSCSGVVPSPKGSLGHRIVGNPGFGQDMLRHLHRGKLSAFFRVKFHRGYPNHDISRHEKLGVPNHSIYNGTFGTTLWILSRKNTKNMSHMSHVSTSSNGFDTQFPIVYIVHPQFS